MLTVGDTYTFSLATVILVDIDDTDDLPIPNNK